MSETVHYKGKIQLVPKIKDESIEEQCKRILHSYNYMDLPDYCDNWKEYLYEELYKEYVITNNDIYQVIEKKDYPDEYDIFEAHQVSPTEYEYEVMYYNGVCSFIEAIEKALNSVT